jgi:hypothetical protein
MIGYYSNVNAQLNEFGMFSHPSEVKDYVEQVKKRPNDSNLRRYVSYKIKLNIYFLVLSPVSPNAITQAIPEHKLQPYFLFLRLLKTK